MGVVYHTVADGVGDGEAIFDKMIYSLTNPSKGHLVNRVLNWPGLNSLRYQRADRPLVVKRPAWFFSKNGDLPEEVTLRFVRPPEFAHLRVGPVQSTG